MMPDRTLAGVRNLGAAGGATRCDSIAERNALPSGEIRTESGTVAPSVAPRHGDPAMTWEFERSVQARASREQVWSILTNVADWPRWNPGVGRVQLEEPVTVGAMGTIRAPGGPPSTLKILTIEPGRRLVTETSEPLFRLRFDQELADGDDGELLISYRVRMTGP